MKATMLPRPGSCGVNEFYELFDERTLHAVVARRAARLPSIFTRVFLTLDLSHGLARSFVPDRAAKRYKVLVQLEEETRNIGE